jgi:uncharacterized protein (DUF3820 family)
VASFGTCLPFGKHKGKPLPEVPPEYLAWVVTECETIDTELRQSILRHIEAL